MGSGDPAEGNRDACGAGFASGSWKPMACLSSPAHPAVISDAAVGAFDVPRCPRAVPG
jgi:hypothetical protein